MRPLPRVILLLPSAALLACGDAGGGDSPDAAADAVTDGSGEPDAVEDATQPDADAGVDDAEAGDDGADTGGADRTLGPGDGAHLVVDPSGIELWKGETLLTRIAATDLRLGAVPRLDSTRSYDPVGFFAPGPQQPDPPLDRWLAARSLACDGDDDALACQLELDDGSTATLNVRLVADGSFSLELTPGADSVATTAYLRVRASLETREEAIYGLGELFDTPNSRGLVRAMQLEIDGLEGANNEAHVPIPFLTSTRGWGLFVANRRVGVFDVGAADPDAVDTVFGTGDASGDGLLFYLFADDHPLDVTRHYYEVTGFPARPARWALGPLVWRDENRDQAEVEADLATMRDRDLPCTGIWIDRPYASAVNSFDFNPAQFPDAQAMIDRAHDLGFRVSLWHTPYVEDAPATETLLAEAAAGSFLVATHSILLNGWGAPVDFTNAQAYIWWQRNIRRYTDMGIEGFKLDYAEDIVPNLLGGRPLWAFADGSDERTMHHDYQLLYHRVYAETLPESGGFLLARGGTWGDQVNASVIWPGDLDASFARHREDYTDPRGETYKAVGGLPAALVASLSLGPSGYPLFASDTGGYRHSPPDKETFVRWLEITALSPAMQIGTSTNDVAWEYTDENGFDDESLAIYTRYTRLHLRLWPYFWTYLDRLASDGRAIQRAIGLAHPELGVHVGHEWMLGDDLLVAAVVDRGATDVEVAFPEGRWVSWWDGTTIEGPTTETLPAPLDTIALFVREGAVVPLLAPDIETLSATTEPERVRSYANDAGRLHIRTTRGGEGAFTLFDGATVSHTPDGSATTWTVSAGAELGATFELEVLAVAAPPTTVTQGGEPVAAMTSSAELDGASSGYFYDADAHALRVRGAAVDGSVRVD
ncbi:MAG: glycoside hydrolase family 31 protein [Myxococcales bacterium]|nr:glycoside hydrolase family 31 protein [Myxococcales bacterium]